MAALAAFTQQHPLDLHVVLYAPAPSAADDDRGFFSRLGCDEPSLFNSSYVPDQDDLADHAARIEALQLIRFAPRRRQCEAAGWSRRPGRLELPDEGFGSWADGMVDLQHAFQPHPVQTRFPGLFGELRVRLPERAPDETDEFEFD